MVARLRGGTRSADGYAEARHLSADASALSTVGTWYDFFKGKAEAYLGGLPYATSIPESRRHVVEGQCDLRVHERPASEHAVVLGDDHRLGMTRLNVYAGPAGFYLLRGGPGDDVGGGLGQRPRLATRRAPATRSHSRSRTARST